MGIGTMVVLAVAVFAVLYLILMYNGLVNLKHNVAKHRAKFMNRQRNL